MKDATTMLHIILHLVIFINLGLCLQDDFGGDVGGYGEYCQMDTFNATCPAGHVILMTHARYGRMQKGKCAKQDYGHIGCFRDALEILDSRCSGKNKCSILVPDPVLDKTQPCPEDLKPYLQVRHSCVKVMESNPQCTVDNSIQVSENAGYLLHSITHPDECGGYHTPWKIYSKKGQTVKITFYDFNVNSRISNSYNHCQLMAILREISGDQIKNITVCGRTSRELIILETQANHVEVVTRPSLSNQDTYMLKYEIMGCPEFKAPLMSWVARNGESVLVKCNFTRQIYEMTCTGNKWEGHIQNCSLVGLPASKDNSDQEPIPYGISVLIVIIIALVIGLVVLAIGLLFLRKQHNMCMRQPQQRTETTYCSSKDYAPGTYYQSYQPKQRPDLSNSKLPHCASLIRTNSSMYGQLPDRMTCGCPVYISRDELAEVQNIRPCPVDGHFRSSSEILDAPHSHTAPRTVAEPDLTAFTDRKSNLLQTLQTDSLSNQTLQRTHSTFKGNTPVKKTEDIALRLRLDNALNEAICDDAKVYDTKTQVVKPMSIMLPKDPMTVSTYQFQETRVPNSC